MTKLFTTLLLVLTSCCNSIPSKPKYKAGDCAIVDFTFYSNVCSIIKIERYYITDEVIYTASPSSNDYRKGCPATLGIKESDITAKVTCQKDF